jgi:diadenosine tetraphosphatase ApaH/serine/threonine PP2A family protein phosphatase
VCGGSKIAAVVGEEFPELRQSPLPIVVAGDFFRDTPRTGARSLKQITGDAMNTHTAAAHSVRNGYGDGNVGARLVWNPRSRGGTEDGRWRYLYCRTRWESARGARSVVTARTSRGRSSGGFGRVVAALGHRSEQKMRRTRQYRAAEVRPGG